MKKKILIAGAMFFCIGLSTNSFAGIKEVKGQATKNPHPGGGPNSHDLTCPGEGQCYTINEEEGTVIVNFPGGPVVYGYVAPPVLIQNPDQSYSQIGSLNIVENQP